MPQLQEGNGFRVDVRQVLRIVRRQALLVAVAGLIGLLLGGAVHLLQEPRYEATAVMLLKQNDPA